MVTENIHLTGMVLHSPNLERMVSFYRGILGAEFKQEQHGNKPIHYACEYGKDELLEIYPSEAKVTPASPSIVFRVPSLEAIYSRMGKHFERAIDLHIKDIIRCYDSDNRKVYLHEDQTEKEVSLEEVILHSQNLENLKSFYHSLLGLEPQARQYKEVKSYVFGHKTRKLKLESSPKAVTPPTPVLLFSSSTLPKIATRMKAEIKESPYAPGGKEIFLHDDDGRKVIVYEIAKTAPENSWWQKLFQ